MLARGDYHLPEAMSQGLTEKAKKYNEMTTWKTFVEHAQQDMGFPKSDLVVETCAKWFLETLHWPDPQTPDADMIKATKSPDLKKPGPTKGDVAGDEVPDIATMSMINRMLKVLVVLKEDEMESNYTVMKSDKPTAPPGPANGVDHHDSSLMNQLDFAVLRAGGGRQSMEEKAVLRNFTKACLGPTGITFDVPALLKLAHMHGEAETAGAGQTWPTT